MQRDVIANIENGRRAQVTVDELAGLALALDTSPIALLLPLDQPGTGVAVTSSTTVDVMAALEWLRGGEPLPGQDAGMFVHTTLPVAAEQHVRNAAELASALHSEKAHAEYVGDPAQIADARARLLDGLETLAAAVARLRALGFEPGRLGEHLVDEMRAAGLSI